jgi:DNA-binding transcriptional ArsR family regulator
LIEQVVEKLDPVKILTGDEAIDAVRALNDENRRHILHALRARRMSTTELCEFLARDDPGKEVKPQTVRYHIKELEKCGLVEQDGYEPAGNGDSHIMKKLWRATAENIFIATENMDDLPEREVSGIDETLDIIGIMKKLGFKLVDEDNVKALAAEYMERDSLHQKGRQLAMPILQEISALDPAVFSAMRQILSVIRLSDADYQRYWKCNRSLSDRLREAFRKGAGKNPEVY